MSYLMIYQLCNGRTIEFSTEQYCSMGDDEFNDSVSYHTSHNEGQAQENPWFGSVLTNRPSEDYPEAFFENTPDIMTMDPADKLQDLDIEYFSEE